MEYVYKFVSWDVPALESLANSKAYQLMNKLNRGGKLSREEKDWVAEETVYRSGVYRLLGWEFFFCHYMRRFVVRLYNEWSCHRAFDKTSLRKALGTGVKEIHEIK